MAYVSNLKHAVLFGGSSLHGDSLGDTWTWSSGCWTQRFPAHSPQPQHYVVMAYDAGHGVALLNTPGDPSGTEQATWSWDGTDWTKLADGPKIHGAPAATAYDKVRGKVVLYGGVGNASATETWTWTGTAWQAMAPRQSPPARQAASMAFDPNTGKVLLFGGMTLADGLQRNDTWAWDGRDWAQLNPVASPAPRQGAALATFGAKSQVVLIGGWSVAPFTDAWAWDGVNWHQVASLGPRQNATAVDAGDSVLLFGGTLQSTANTDLWDGVTWTTS